MRGRGVRRFFLGTWNMKGFLSEERPIRTLREVLQRLRESYCGQIGYEVSAARPSSAELLRTLIQTCRVFDVSVLQPACCYWGTVHGRGLRAALCACSTCTSRTGSAATGSESASRLLRRCARFDFHLLYPPPPTPSLAPTHHPRLGRATCLYHAPHRKGAAEGYLHAQVDGAICVNPS